jgi:hypothetical protein
VSRSKRIPDKLDASAGHSYGQSKNMVNGVRVSVLPAPPVSAAV